MAEQVQYYGTGRRKSSVARVFLRPGSGKITVNAKGFEEYFVTPAQRAAARRPLETAEATSQFDVLVTTSGGGVNGQLERDARGKERKKYGQKGARKRFQFSKR